MEDKRALLACCADLYRLPAVRLLMGDSLHPGGLGLTRALAKRIALTREDRVLDVACGQGTSAVMLAQVFKCRVTGLDADAQTVGEARQSAQRYRLHRSVAFVHADACSLPLASCSFDAVLCECATALFPDASWTLREMVRVLRPGGRLALSDVTFRPTSLPEALDTPLAQALCIPLGMGPDRYVRLIEGARLQVQDAADCSWAIRGLLEKATALLGVNDGLPDSSYPGSEQLPRAAVALQCVRTLVDQDDLGYWTFIAQKPESFQQGNPTVIEEKVMPDQPVRIYGALWCGDCRRAKRLFDEHHIPYEWIDTEQDQNARAFVQKINNGKRIIPTIVFPDGSILVEPTNAELAHKLGIR